MTAGTRKPDSSFGRLLVRKMTPILLLAAAVAAVAGIAIFIKGRQTAAPPKVLPPVPVDVELVQPVRLEDTFELTGVVEPYEVVSVSPELAGTIEEMPVTKGSPVRQGQLLVRLNEDLIQAEVDQASAQHEYDKREYDRLGELREKNFATEKELDDAAVRIDLSRAALKLANERLKRMRIYAPVSGILNDLPLEQGEYADAAKSIAEIVQIDKVKVLVDVPEVDIKYLGVGDEPQVLTDSLVLPGRITYMSELAERRTRTTKVEVTVDNSPDAAGKRPLRAGRIVRVRFSRGRLNGAVFVPLEVVIPQERRPGEPQNAGIYNLYVVENGRARRRDVKLGIFKGRRVQVTQGLRGGDLLIVSGHRQVSPDQDVKVRRTLLLDPSALGADVKLAEGSTQPATGVAETKPGREVEAGE